MASEGSARNRKESGIGDFLGDFLGDAFLSDPPKNLDFLSASFFEPRLLLFGVGCGEASGVDFAFFPACCAGGGEPFRFSPPPGVLFCAVCAAPFAAPAAPPAFFFAPKNFRMSI